MTGKERFLNQLKGNPIDRIGLYEHFWNDTHKKWEERGWVDPKVDFDDLFDFDFGEAWVFNLTADLDFKDEIVAQDADTVTIKNGNGAILRNHKFHDTTPEHVDFTVKERKDWEKIILPKLTCDERRINFEVYRQKKQQCAEHGRFFCWSGVNVFESIHPVCGHENLLVGMALDPEWVKEMASVYTDLIIDLWKILFEREGKPDGIWFYEDMGFKLKPFMSPAMYEELIMPAHVKTIDFAHSLGLPVIMHSCGFVEPLMPYMIEAGIDCLQALEVKAGMDLVKLYKQYSDKICFMGGIDVRALYSNDKNIINKELESKIPFIKEGYKYILHSDHSIPESVNIDSYRYFIERGLELGTY